ncbi:MAG: hypothetical protein KDD29_01035 [Flavobacteriales bacterium]|nr:hypothetical protein [Flavobacteriales bacterium]MCB9336027.1 hypothetical protein [Flavobacteriales bacterium]
MKIDRKKILLAYIIGTVLYVLIGYLFIRFSGSDNKREEQFVLQAIKATFEGIDVLFKVMINYLWLPASAFLGMLIFKEKEIKLGFLYSLILTLGLFFSLYLL